MNENMNANTMNANIRIESDINCVTENEKSYFGEDRIITAMELVPAGTYSIPTVVIETLTGRKYFLQPFRGYRFQISGSAKGSGDYGSSTVVGLANVLRLEQHNPPTESRSSIYASNVVDLIDEYFNLLIEQAMHDWGWDHVRTHYYCSILPAFVKQVRNWVQEEITKDAKCSA